MFVWWGGGGSKMKQRKQRGGEKDRKRMCRSSEGFVISDGDNEALERVQGGVVLFTAVHADTDK